MRALARALDIDPGPRTDSELVSACLSGMNRRGAS